jgi:hypothetical protein
VLRCLGCDEVHYGETKCACDRKIALSEKSTKPLWQIVKSKAKKLKGAIIMTAEEAAEHMAPKQTKVKTRAKRNTCASFGKKCNQLNKCEKCPAKLFNPCYERRQRNQRFETMGGGSSMVSFGMATTAGPMDLSSDPNPPPRKRRKKKVVAIVPELSLKDLEGLDRGIDF